MTEDGRYEEDDFEDDEFERNIIKWNETVLEKYLNNFIVTISKEDQILTDIEIIETYYPGTMNLRDDELIRRKYYPSYHSFQYAVAVKRMFEETNRGIVIELSDGWRFGIGSGV